jgi:hypothetical protein
MKPSIKKVASGKTMRVATVFTGAAACAAAFAPAAHAVTGHQAEANAKTLADATTVTVSRPGTMHRFQPDISAAPQTSEAGCSTTPRYLHFRTSVGTVCFGHLGSFYFGPYPVIMTSICGGNNSGSYSNGFGKVAKFHTGTTFVHVPWYSPPVGNIQLERIRITKVYPAADDKCP